MFHFKWSANHSDWCKLDLGVLKILEVMCSIGNGRRFCDSEAPESYDRFPSNQNLKILFFMFKMLILFFCTILHMLKLTKTHYVGNSSGYLSLISEEASRVPHAPSNTAENFQL